MRQRDRQTKRQGEREAGRQGCRESGRQGDRETGRQGLDWFGIAWPGFNWIAKNLFCHPSPAPILDYLAEQEVPKWWSALGPLLEV